MNWPQVSQFSQPLARRFFHHGHVCPDSTQWRLTRMILRRRCRRVREKLLWLSCSGFLGKPWSFRMNWQETKGFQLWNISSSSWLSHESSGNHRKTHIFRPWMRKPGVDFFHDIWTWAAENRSQQWPSHPRGLMYWFVEASFPESTRWWFSQL